MSPEMVDQRMPYGPKYVSMERLAEPTRSIRPAVKRVEATKQLGELDAVGQIRRLQEVRAELTERQAEVDAELGRVLGAGFLERKTSGP